MNFLLILAQEADRRSLIISIVILVILFLFIGLLGGLWRFVFNRQADRAEGFLNNVVRSHVVKNGKELRRFGFKANNRALFRDSLWPFSILALMSAIYLVECLITHNWTPDIFGDFAELFFWFDWNAEGVIIRFFGLSIIGSIPPVSHNPEFHIEHLHHYIEVALLIVAGVWYFVVCQGYVARAARIDSLSHSIYHPSLRDYKAGDDIHVTPDSPLPPGE